jgi:hypothetical protein
MPDSSKGILTQAVTQLDGIPSQTETSVQIIRVHEPNPRHEF